MGGVSKFTQEEREELRIFDAKIDNNERTKYKRRRAGISRNEYQRLYYQEHKSEAKIYFAEKHREYRTNKKNRIQTAI